MPEESLNKLRPPCHVTPQLPWTHPCSFTSQKEGLVPIPVLPPFKHHQNEDPSKNKPWSEPSHSSQVTLMLCPVHHFVQTGSGKACSNEGFQVLPDSWHFLGCTLKTG